MWQLAECTLFLYVVGFYLVFCPVKKNGIWKLTTQKCSFGGLSGLSLIGSMRRVFVPRSLPQYPLVRSKQSFGLTYLENGL